jgi:hypothetical protein
MGQWKMPMMITTFAPEMRFHFLNTILHALMIFTPLLSSPIPPLSP